MIILKNISLGGVWAEDSTVFMQMAGLLVTGDFFSARLRHIKIN